MPCHAAPRPPSLALRWLPVAAALLSTSCAGGLNPVEGKVLYNGQPAKGAVVIFHPKGDDNLKTVRPTGVTDDSGTFHLSTRKPGDGAAAGEYVVTIVYPDPAKAPKTTLTMEPPPDPSDLLQGRYADRTKSQLQAVVKSGRNQLEPFEVK
jgi:hypothetical protein